MKRVYTGIYFDTLQFFSFTFAFVPFFLHCIVWLRKNPDLISTIKEVTERLFVLSRDFWTFSTQFFFCLLSDVFEAFTLKVKLFKIAM